MLQLKITFVISTIISIISSITAFGYRFYEYNRTFDSKAFELTIGKNYALPDWVFPVDQSIREKVHTPAIQGATWTYALCDNQTSGNQVDYECAVYFETHNLNGVTYREECQDILENMKEYYRDHIRVYRFGKAKSILLWQNADNTVYLDVINFRDCNVTRTHLQLTQKLTDCTNSCIDVAVRSDDEYDVFFAKVTKGSSVWYVSTYDAKGENLKKPTEFLKTSSLEQSESIIDSFTIVPMTPSSSIQKHLILTFDYQSKSHSWYLDKNGTRTKPPTAADIHIASTAHNRLGFCSIKNDILTCQQVDEHGTKKFEKTIKLQHRGRPEPDYLNSHIYGYTIAVMHNLPDGGFIVVLEDCVYVKVCSRPVDPYRLYMFKVGADGTRYRKIVVRNLSRELKPSHFEEPYGILEDQPNEYCLYKNYVLRDKDYSTQLVVECFSDELLSQTY